VVFAGFADERHAKALGCLSHAEACCGAEMASATDGPMELVEQRAIGLCEPVRALLEGVSQVTPIPWR
jgi:hypothetical protein